MLRGVRFAATFGFELESETMAAIQKRAGEISVVSGERIGAEMRRMLASPNRAIAARLLRESGLLGEILNDGASLYQDSKAWEETLASLERLGEEDFSSAASILLEPIIIASGVILIVEQWKLSNDERDSIQWICKNWSTLDRAEQLPWSKLQPILLHRDVGLALAVADARRESSSPGAVHCRERLAWPKDKLDPAPFLSGSDLIRMGIKSGPKFKPILAEVRRAQLDGEIVSSDEAQKLAQSL